MCVSLIAHDNSRRLRRGRGEGNSEDVDCFGSRERRALLRDRVIKSRVAMNDAHTARRGTRVPMCVCVNNFRQVIGISRRLLKYLIGLSSTSR